MRAKKSIYDPYMDDIEEMLESGYTYRQIEEALFDMGLYDADSNAISYIVRSRGLKSRVTQGARDGRYIPRCAGCVKCIEVTNTTGHEVQMCTELLQLISKSVMTSPMECPKRTAGRRAV